MPKGKWNRETKIKEAQEQMIFTSTGALKHNESKLVKPTQPQIDFNKKVTCPFCLAWAGLGKFLISTKKGYNQGQGHCPECNQNMKLKTLFGLGKWPPEQYAQFVVEYPPGGFFDRIHKGVGFETWNQRLKIMKWSVPFWQEYRRLKPKEDGKSTKEEDDLYESMLRNTANEAET